MANRQEQYIDLARGLTRQVWEGVYGLKALQAEWNALDYGNTLPDGTGANEGVTAAEVGAVVVATANAIEGLFNQGHATNMAKLL